MPSPPAGEADEVALAMAVRRHLFLFSRAAAELGLSEASCRERWAALEAQWAAAEERGPLAEQLELSGYNVLTDESLKSRMDQIFEDVRAALPTMAPIAHDERQSNGRPTSAPTDAGSDVGKGAGSGMQPTAQPKQPMRGRGRGVMYSGRTQDSSTDEEADDVSWQQSRHMIKGRGGRHVAPPSAPRRPAVREAWSAMEESEAVLSGEGESDEDSSDVMTKTVGPVDTPAATPHPSAPTWQPWSAIAIAINEEEELAPQHDAWDWEGSAVSARISQVIEIAAPSTPAERAARKERVRQYKHLRGDSTPELDQPLSAQIDTGTQRDFFDEKICAAYAPFPTVMPPASDASATTVPPLTVYFESFPLSSAADISGTLLGLLEWMETSDISPSQLSALQVFAGVPDDYPRLVAAISGIVDAQSATAITARPFPSARLEVCQEWPETLHKLSEYSVAYESCVVPSVEGATAVADNQETLPISVLLLKDDLLEKWLDGGLAKILLDLQSEGLDVAGARLLYISDPQHTSSLGLDTSCASGRVLALLVRGREVSERLLRLSGAADPRIAKRIDPSSWRAAFGKDRLHNACAACRHATAGRRSAAFFFGGREGMNATAPKIYYGFVSQSSHALLAAPAACDVETLLARLEKFGLDLCAASRVATPQLQQRLRLPAIGGKMGDDTADNSVLVLLLSRGDAARRAEAAIAGTGGCRPTLFAPVPDVALDFLLRNADPLRTITRDTAPNLYSHLRFSLRNEMI